VPLRNAVFARRVGECNPLRDESSNSHFDLPVA
jgi:hypothetical protein